MFTSLKQFTYLADKGTKFVWLEDLSRIQITWNGDQLFEVEARKKPEKSLLDLINGTVPNYVQVPTEEKQELTVGFSGEDLWEWVAYLISWTEVDLREVLVGNKWVWADKQKECNLNQQKLEPKLCFPEPKRRGRREL